MKLKRTYTLRIKALSILLTWSLVGISFSFLGQVKSLVREGNENYHEQKFQEADSLYKLAILEVDSFIPAIYNDGLALYQLNNFSESEARFNQVITKGDDTLKANAYYNLANVALKQWYKTDAHLGLIKMNLDQLAQEEAADVEDKMDIFTLKDSLLKEQKKLLSNKKALLNKAIERYKSCLRLNPKDNDARYNLVYAYKLRPLDQNQKNQDDKDKKDQEPSEFALKMKKKALELVEQNKFVEAYQLLMSAKQKDPTVGNFDKLIQKLGVITKIKQSK